MSAGLGPTLAVGESLDIDGVAGGSRGCLALALELGARLGYAFALDSLLLALAFLARSVLVELLAAR
jgi:hypothetical protein